MREKLIPFVLMLTLLLASFTTDAQAQRKQKEIRIEFKKAPMSDVLKKLQNASGYQILPQFGIRTSYISCNFGIR
ncbi:MAG: hypothetical protein ACI3YX_10050, partial [Prevotella sp.]